MSHPGLCSACRSPVTSVWPTRSPQSRAGRLPRPPSRNPHPGRQSGVQRRRHRLGRRYGPQGKSRSSAQKVETMTTVRLSGSASSAWRSSDHQRHACPDAEPAAAQAARATVITRLAQSSRGSGSRSLPPSAGAVMKRGGDGRRIQRPRRGARHHGRDRDRERGRTFGLDSRRRAKATRPVAEDRKHSFLMR